MKIADILQELAHLREFVPLQSERYAACMESYESSSDQRELISSWFAGAVVPDLPRDHARVLSIGCGAGDLDEEFVAAGAGHASALSYVGVEPDASQCDRFRSRLTAASDPHVRVEAHHTRFEEFDSGACFDLVMMVHSLYYMEDPALALEKARGLVADGGRLVVLIASNDVLNELSSAFWTLENGRPSWFSEDLLAHLERSQVSFERSCVEATLDVTACCEPGSESGTRIADFLAQVCTESLPEPLRRMIFRHLDGIAHDEDGRRWLPHNVDAFTIEGAPPSPFEEDVDGGTDLPLS